MPYQNILLEQPETGIYLLTVNRPKVLNALNRETLEEIGEAVAAVAADAGARALLLTGAGDRAFVAGADIAVMREYTPLEAKAFSEQAMRVMRSLEALPVPVIAVVNGYCLGGGCELALACDWVVASERAVFGQPEVSLGVIPGFGGTQRLTRVVGRARAMELVTTGRHVKAEEALAIGLAQHVYAPESLMDEAMEAARAVGSTGPVAVRLAKQVVHRGTSMSLEDALVLEADAFALCFASDDQTEGMAAFLDKRPAGFRGR